MMGDVSRPPIALKTPAEVFCAVELGIISRRTAAELFGLRPDFFAWLHRPRPRLAGKSAVRFWLLHRGGVLRPERERRPPWWTQPLPAQPKNTVNPDELPF